MVKFVFLNFKFIKPPFILQSISSHFCSFHILQFLNMLKFDASIQFWILNFGRFQI